MSSSALKRFLYSGLVIALVAAAFWAGSAYNKHTSGNNSTDRVDNTGVDQSAAGGSDLQSEDADEDSSFDPDKAVVISPERQQLIGVRTGIAQKGVITKKVRLFGRVAADENRIYKVKTVVEGVIQEVYPSTTGSMVKKGQPLAAYYSPDIYSAEQGYLIAVSSDRYLSSLQVQVTKSRLEFLGMSPEQIEDLRKKGEIEEKIIMQSPATGFVLSRDISPDYRFQKGEELYRIAALDHVWIYADMYETEGRYVRPGIIATVHHPLLRKKLRARVSEVLPLFDAAARTLKVRLECDNPGFVLRPDMFVDIDLPVSIPAAVTVPGDAIVNAGLKKIVFVDHGDGMFEPRKVETGFRFGDRVQIVKGLKPGEKIAVAGTFLIDSEVRLKTPSGYD